MAEEAAENSPDVMLGFDAAWGYAPADQTSPALAAAAPPGGTAASSRRRGRSAFRRRARRGLCGLGTASGVGPFSTDGELSAATARKI